MGHGWGFALSKDLQRLNEKWHTLPRHIQEVILMLARVRKIPRTRTKADTWPQKPRETPEWLLTAITILKDSKGYITDREIAKRVGVSPSTLSRNEAYGKAKRTYLQPYQTIGRSGL
ncbi:MAG TPA: hypothetical protein VEK08_09550 [Planctomycetota bacterium]|nr:hypothetical protein [Planctomycetota bacterium]